MRALSIGLAMLSALSATAVLPSETPNGQPAVPLGNPGDWVTSNDYPPDARIGNVTGVTGFSLAIGKSGQVENCIVIASSGSDTLDKATCDLITLRARFQPAKDTAGQSTVGAYRNRVRWILPNVKTETRPLGPSVQEFTFISEINGTISDCNVLQQQNFGNRPPQDICSGFIAQWQGPVRDGYGTAMRKRVTVRATTTGETTVTTTVTDP